MDEQLKPAHTVVDAVDLPYRKICVTMLRHNVNQPESSYAQERIVVRRKGHENFLQIVYVNHQFEETFYLLDVMNSVFDKICTNKPICNVQ